MSTSFILKNMGKVERYNNGVCIKGLTFSEFEVDYYEKLEEVWNYNIIASIIKSFYSKAIGMTPLTNESE